MKQGGRWAAWVALAWVGLAQASDRDGPDCASWPTNMAEVQLKNLGRLNLAQVDLSGIKAERLTSQSSGHDDYGKVIYRQIHDIRFPLKDGREVRVVTDSKSSDTECSIGTVDVYVVSRMIDGSRP